MRPAVLRQCESAICSRGAPGGSRQRGKGGKAAARRAQAASRPTQQGLGGPASPVVRRCRAAGVCSRGCGASAQQHLRGWRAGVLPALWRDHPGVLSPQHHHALLLLLCGVDSHGLGYRGRLHQQKCCNPLCKSRKLIMGQRWSLSRMVTSACVHFMNSVTPPNDPGFEACTF